MCFLEPKLYELEAQLYKDIVKNEKYQPQFRPTDTTIINFSVSLASIVEVVRSAVFWYSFMAKAVWYSIKQTKHSSCQSILQLF